MADNLARLKVLFPDAFTEGGIDFDALRLLLGDAMDDGFPLRRGGVLDCQ